MDKVLTNVQTILGLSFILFLYDFDYHCYNSHFSPYKLSLIEIFIITICFCLNKDRDFKIKIKYPNE